MFYSLHLHGDAKLAMLQTAKHAHLVDQLILLVILAKMPSMEVVQPHALLAQLTALYAVVHQFVQHAQQTIVKMEVYAILIMLLALLLMLTEHVLHAVLDMPWSALPVQPAHIHAKIAPPRPPHAPLVSPIIPVEDTIFLLVLVQIKQLIQDVFSILMPLRLDSVYNAIARMLL